MSSIGEHMDGAAFASALRSGVHRVIGQQEHLNSINVFPVADSDTGTNLSLSLHALLDVLKSPEDLHLGTTLAAIADTLLDNARGNSGAIMAQFFQGMSDAAGEISRFTTYTFSKAVTSGSEYAHDALAKPREGTIISVIAAFATSIRHQTVKLQNNDFAAVLRTAQQRAQEALAETPDQLEVLRKAGVVDAGAQGFVELINGLCDHMITGEATPAPAMLSSHDIEPAVAFSDLDNSSVYRYCTECLVTGDNIDRRKLREALTDIGDSMVLAGSKRKAKIHIHVDDPDAVFEIAAAYGELSGAKADDMHRQQNATHDQSRQFAVITDSAADINDDDMETLDIHMVPCRVQFGERGYLDKVSITPAEFYAELESNPHHPTTSQPTAGDFRRQYQFLASHFRDVLSINLTSAASGTCQAAQSAATRNNASGQIHVVDSKNASIGQGMLVVFAAECAQAGLSAQQTLSAVKAQILKTHTFALLHDTNYAVRGGRLPGWVKTVADCLHLTPIICTKPSGRVALSGFIFGRSHRIRKFARFVANRTRGDQALEASIGHAVCEDDAMQLESRLSALLPTIRKLKICELGTALGVHGGPGTLLIATRPLLSAQDVADGLD